MAASVNTAAPATPRRWSRYKVRETIEGYLLISPWLIGFLVFTLGPMLASLYFSFTHYSIVSAPRFIGIDNYVRALGGQDRLFYVSLQRTMEFVLMYVPLGVAISLGLAVLLNQKLRGAGSFRTLFFIPTLTPIAAAALIWTWLLHPDVGPINYFLSLVGIQGPRWLGSPQWAVPAIVLAALWGSVGGSRMIIFLAGLQGVPQELLDSAHIDGANTFQRFWHVTLPLISPVVFFNIILTTLAAVRVFALAIIATNGGPSYATWFYMLHLYNQAFRSLQMGYASALAWIFFVIVLGFTIVQFRLAARWVHYAGEKE